MSICRYCSGLTKIYSSNPTPPSISADDFTEEQYQNIKVYVPLEALEAYRMAEVWKEFAKLRGYNFTAIDEVKADGITRGNVYYDLGGRRLPEPRKGLNIINGKKVLIK